MTETVRKGLGQRVRERRRHLSLSVLDAARLAEINPKTWNALESGTRSTRDQSYASIERALRWQTGSIETVLDGGDSTPLPDLEDLVHLLLTTTTDEDREQIGRLLRAGALQKLLSSVGDAAGFSSESFERHMKTIAAVDADPLFARIGRALSDERLPEDLRDHLRRGVERAYEAWLQWVKTLGQEPSGAGREQVGH